MKRFTAGVFVLALVISPISAQENSKGQNESCGRAGNERGKRRGVHAAAGTARVLYKTAGIFRAFGARGAGVRMCMWIYERTAERRAEVADGARSFRRANYGVITTAKRRCSAAGDVAPGTRRTTDRAEFSAHCADARVRFAAGRARRLPGSC